MDPDILYKYRSLAGIDRDRVMETFSNSSVYFSSPDQFNDPFDCKVELLLDGTEDEWKQYIGEKLKIHRPSFSPADRLVEMNRIIRSGNYKKLNPTISTRAAKEAGVYCVSAVNDDILMWSHYANAHRGICIGFRAKVQDYFFRRSQEVKYFETYPSTRIFDSDEKRMETALLAKSAHWSYEKEFRIIEPHGSGVHQFPEELLVEVILGCQISDDDKKTVLEWAHKRLHRPRVFIARKKSREFGLFIEEAL